MKQSDILSVDLPLNTQKVGQLSWDRSTKHEKGKLRFEYTLGLYVHKYRVYTGKGCYTLISVV